MQENNPLPNPPPRTVALLEEVLADYIRGCEAGTPPDRELLIQRHPELAMELRQFFAQRDRIHRVARQTRSVDSTLQQLAAGPGQKLSYVGEYELIEEIARGGMGVVFKARQQGLGRIVAVKMILAGYLATEQDVQRFQIEAQAAASLQHPNIVAIHQVGQHEGWHYFSMDYVEGRNLSELLRENLLPAREAAAYIRQIAKAIHYAHRQGTLHRDLKPSNVLIDEQGQVRITDFGLAMRVESGQDVTQTGQILGTPSYMPPEQARADRGQLGPASDVYALGAVLYECLTGRPPFRAESVVKTIEQVLHKEPATPRLLNSVVPRDLETICLKCLRKEPGRRYGSAQELAEDLDRFLNGRPILARRVSRSERAWRWCRRNPVVASLSTATLILLVTAATVSGWAAYREARLRRDADDARARLEKAYVDLQAEQLRGSQLQLSIDQLEQRRQELDQSLADGTTRLLAGEEKLFQTYLQLAQGAWRAENVELADYYLSQCPAHLRNTFWQNLKQQCYPQQVSLAGQSCVAISRDGRWLAAVSQGSVGLWEMSSQQQVRTLSSDSATVRALAFSPDGTRLAAAAGTAVVVWDLASGEVSRTLTGHSVDVTDVAFSPEGRQLASASSIQFRSTGEERGEVI
ncbi:MAG: WD40 repeat domain-containing serine/threonine protein kinase, partial [Pirellulaceae bacterium]